jgi:hypothetical protein
MNVDEMSQVYGDVLDVLIAGGVDVFDVDLLLKNKSSLAEKDTIEPSSSSEDLVDWCLCHSMSTYSKPISILNGNINYH